MLIPRQSPLCEAPMPSTSSGDSPFENLQYTRHCPGHWGHQGQQQACHGRAYIQHERCPHSPRCMDISAPMCFPSQADPVPPSVPVTAPGAASDRKCTSVPSMSLAHHVQQGRMIPSSRSFHPQTLTPYPRDYRRWLRCKWLMTLFSLCALKITNI